jgi:predicted transcriptional regulator of viral defense system
MVGKIMSSNINKALEIFKNNNGILRSSEAQKLGINPMTIARMLENGLISKEARGLYRLSDSDIEGDPNLINVAKLVPKAVVCLISALSFHEMTTQIPRKVYIALPREYKSPSIEYPPIEIFYLSDKPYKAGIEEHEIGGISVAIYNRAKTVTDCFKFRSKIGEDVATEALKDYLRDENRSIEQLLRYATINRVKKRMEPYIKALI